MAAKLLTSLFFIFQKNFGEEGKPSWNRGTKNPNDIIDNINVLGQSTNKRIFRKYISAPQRSCDCLFGKVSSLFFLIF
jgi:hypothetical protein